MIVWFGKIFDIVVIRFVFELILILVGVIVLFCLCMLEIYVVTIISSRVRENDSFIC